MRRALWIIGAVALVAVLAIGISQAGGGKDETTSSADVSVDDPGTIRDADVKSFAAEVAKHKGKPVVVNGWASWCGPCKLEFPIFRTAAQKLDGQVVFLGLNVSDNREDAEAFLEKEPVPYDSFDDGDARIAQKAGASGGLPITIFYDRDGKLAFLHQGGYETEKDLRKDIERYTGA
jgi:cytochrome c biogenesis protein CcmG/thiol:disulfide interchange protein DsbE